jgi:hypothetical protein
MAQTRRLSGRLGLPAFITKAFSQRFALSASGMTCDVLSQSSCA